MDDSSISCKAGFRRTVTVTGSTMSGWISQLWTIPVGDFGLICLKPSSIAGRNQRSSLKSTNDHDWLTYWSDGQAFDAPCGRNNLGDALIAFAAFARGVSLSNAGSPDGSIWTRAHQGQAPRVQDDYTR